MQLLTRSVLLVSLAVAVAVQGAPLRFGPEVPLTAPEFGEPRAGALQPAVATDGKNYFAAWSDGRGGVFGARVTPDGTLLDPLNIFLGDGYGPAVVWTGQAYIVAWGSNDNQTIWATKVSPEGEIVDSQKLADYRGGKLDLAANEDNVVLVSAGNEAVYVVMDENLHVYYRRVIAPEGKQVRDLDVTALRGRNQYLLAAVTAGDEQTGGSVYTYEIGRIGPPSGSPRLVPNSDGASEVSVASNGSTYLVAFDREREIRTQVVTRENTLVGGTTAVTPAPGVSSFESDVVSPRLAWRGSEYVMAYRLGGSDRAQLLRLAAEGTPIGVPSQPFAATGDHFALTARTDGTGVVARSEAGRLRLSFFDSASLAAGAPFFKSIAPARAAHAQVLPAAEEIEGKLAVAWAEESADASEIRLSYSGRTVVAGRPPLAVYSPAFVDVVWDGEKIVVLWHIAALPQQLFVRTFTRTLEPLDAAVRMIPTVADAYEIDGVAAGGGAVLVTWETTSRTRVAQVLGREPVTIATDRYSYGDTAPVWDGANFVVFWARPIVPHSASDPNPVDDAIVAVHVTTEGTVVESSPLFVFDRPGKSALSVQASANGANIVLAWPEVNQVVAGRYIGGTLQNVQFLNWESNSFDERLKVVALPDGGADLYWLRAPSTDPNRLDVQHERFGPDFTPGGRTFFTIDVASGHGQQRRFDAAATGLNARIVYARRTPELGYVPRLVVRSSEPIVRRRAVR